MKTIYKWTLRTVDCQTFCMPRGAVALTVGTLTGQTQYDDDVPYDIPCLWCLADPDQPVERQAIYIHGTGRTVCQEATPDSYVGSYQLYGGVFHVFAPGLVRSHAARLAFLEGAVVALRNAVLDPTAGQSS